MTKDFNQEKSKLRSRYEREFFPIVRIKTEEKLSETASKPNIKNMLELGTGLGYSGCVLLSANKNAHLTTIEKEEVFQKKALRNFETFGFKDRVKPIVAKAEDFAKEYKKVLQNPEKDAQNTQIDKNNTQNTTQTATQNLPKFDLIFLDCAKSRYHEMIGDLLDILSPGGVLFADNVLFMGMVNSKEPPKRKHRTIVKNLRDFIDICQRSDKLVGTKVYDIEDGFLIATRR